MCGIIGIVSHKNIVPSLMDGLKRMEYRGYDSAGIAVHAQPSFVYRKAKGKLAALQDRLASNPVEGFVGIGHIRWATHGAPTENNAHPHFADHVSLAMNGIIENWAELKAELEAAGFAFQSETDTEVMCHLVQHYLNQGQDVLDAFYQSLQRLEGSYAFVMMIHNEPEKIYVARHGSPLVIGLGESEMYVGSDALSLAPFTNKVVFLDEGDFGYVDLAGHTIYNKDRAIVDHPVIQHNLSADDTDKGGFDHFMLKEIYEQPKVLADLIDHYIDVENKTIKEMHLGFDVQKLSRMAFIACGTAYHCCLLSKYYMESLGGVAVDVDVASEYRYRDLVQQQNGVFVAFSQSGETADTLGALRRAKDEGQHIVTVVNVESSTMAREADDVLPTIAGPEIGVASTKAFIAQAFVGLCMAVWTGRKRGHLSAQAETQIVTAILELPRLFNHILDHTRCIEAVAQDISKASDLLYLGRKTCFPIALEAALKLKEISYIHAEGYASGEMKHGAIALIDENVPVVVLAPDDEVLEKTLSNMQEVAARKAKVTLIASSETCASAQALHHIPMPKVDKVIAPIVYTLPTQLLAYYAALALGKDVDQPRNLAKSVTVE